MKQAKSINFTKFAGKKYFIKNKITEFCYKIK